MNRRRFLKTSGMSATALALNPFPSLQSLLAVSGEQIFVRGLKDMSAFEWSAD